MSDQFPIKRSIIRRGARIFILLSILGLLGVYFLKEGPVVQMSLDSIDIKFMFFVVHDYPRCLSLWMPVIAESGPVSTPDEQNTHSCRAGQAGKQSGHAA